MKRLIALAVALVVVLPLGARADHIERYVGPVEPRRDFPADFMASLPVDWQADVAAWPWADKRVGGWGGNLAAGDSCAGSAADIPVILVHGTLFDAEFWRANESSDGTIAHVRQRFLDAGWDPCDVWAISYNGQQGNFTYNELNVGDVAGFVRAVMQYRGAAQVRLIGHSLGVTVVRRVHQLNADLLAATEAFVAIAGANHGTTTCHGQGDVGASHVCEELKPASAVSPMSPWLVDLNGSDETPGSSRYLTIYSATADNFYVGPDAHSPRLDGACNVEMGPMAHNTLARGVEAIALFQQWLRSDTLPAARVCS